MKTIILQGQIINVDYIKWISEPISMEPKFNQYSFHEFCIRAKNGKMRGDWAFASGFDIHFLDNSKKSIIFDINDIPLDDRLKLTAELKELKTKEEKMNHFQKVCTMLSDTCKMIAKTKRSKLNEMLNETPPIEII